MISHKGRLSFLSLHAALALAHVSPQDVSNQAKLDVNTGTEILPERIWHNLGMYAPYFPAAEDYTSPPTGCQVVQANILQRHGARGPTPTVLAHINLTLDKIKSAPKTCKELEFVTKLPEITMPRTLNDIGVAESCSAGSQAYRRYADLTKEHPPFVRATDSERPINSSKSWSNAFTAASGGKVTTSLSVVMGASNDTLTVNQCSGAIQTDLNSTTSHWVKKYASGLTEKLNKCAPGAGLIAKDVTHLQALCAFEAVQNPHGAPTPTSPNGPICPEAPPSPLMNPFCTLIDNLSELDPQDPHMWAGWEYFSDLVYYYGEAGPGSQNKGLGSVQGVGYVNELLTRLTGTLTYVQNDRTTVNHTLDDHGATDTFPLFTRGIYADFTQDDLLVAVYGAMGLFPTDGPLFLTHPNPNRAWVSSRMAQFGARMVVEKMHCSGISTQEDGEFVRILVNDAVMPQPRCNGMSKEGLCALPEFIESQSYARVQGQKDWLNCAKDSKNTNTHVEL